MGMVNEREEFERQARAIFLEVYDRAPELQGSLSVEAEVLDDIQPLTFKAVIQCNEKPGPYRTHIVTFRRRTDVTSEDPYHPDNAQAILERVKAFLLKELPVASLYEMFLGRVWVSQTMGYSRVQETLNKLQEQGYLIHTVTPKSSGEGVLIVAHTEGGRISNRCAPLKW